METCFVIQPFDKDKFDQRFIDVFEPAIKSAGLLPYRVDRDPSVRIPIEQIEEGIKNAKICFAEISTDNPNVWYELGFAFAHGKDVIMVTEERLKFPFDIQHRHIITYKISSKSDFEKLEHNITEKIQALISNQSLVKKIIDTPVKESEGLKSHEVTMLLILMENQLTEEENVPLYSLKNYMEQAGFNAIAISISVRELVRQNFIEVFKTNDTYNMNEEYVACKLTKKGEDWIMANQNMIEFRKKAKKQEDFGSDELPF